MLPPFAPSRVRDWTDQSAAGPARAAGAKPSAAVQGPVQSTPAAGPHAVSATEPGVASTERRAAKPAT